MAATSLFTALAASLCCILPIAFALAGVGIVGASTVFATLRPYLLGLTFAFLGVGFYLAYRTPRDACKPNSSCARPAVNRSGRILLWVITPLVFAMAAFPYYSGPVADLLFSESISASMRAEDTMGTSRIVLNVEGMDCAACAASVEKRLRGLPGVREAKVSFGEGKAVVEYDSRLLSTQILEDAIRDAGFRAR
jgi:mercuric ion transport protein